MSINANLIIPGKYIPDIHIPCLVRSIDLYHRRKSETSVFKLSLNFAKEEECNIALKLFDLNNCCFCFNLELFNLHAFKNLFLFKDVQVQSLSFGKESEIQSKCFPYFVDIDGHTIYTTKQIKLQNKKTNYLMPGQKRREYILKATKNVTEE